MRLCLPKRFGKHAVAACGSCAATCLAAAGADDGSSDPIVSLVLGVSKPNTERGETALAVMEGSIESAGPQLVVVFQRERACLYTLLYVGLTTK